MTRSDPSMRRIWFAALACFVVAGSTGSLVRFGAITGLPEGLQLLVVIVMLLYRVRPQNKKIAAAALVEVQ